MYLILPFLFHARGLRPSVDDSGRKQTSCRVLSKADGRTGKTWNRISNLISDWHFFARIISCWQEQRWRYYARTPLPPFRPPLLFLRWRDAYPLAKSGERAQASSSFTRRDTYDRARVDPSKLACEFGQVVYDFVHVLHSYYYGSFCWYSSTAGCFTTPILNCLKFRSTPSSTSGKGPMGVMAWGLIS